MSIPADEVLRTGHYRNKETGEVFFACNCGKQPAHKTLRHIGMNRDKFEHAPAPGSTPPRTVA